MDRKWTVFIIVLLAIVLIFYIFTDKGYRKIKSKQLLPETETSVNPDKWSVVNTFAPGKGQLNAVAITEKGDIILGGESFVALYDKDFKQLWEIKTDKPATALASSGDNIYAALLDYIIVLDLKGQKVDEWGPFETNASITSVSSNEKYVAFADAANKMVYILKKNGVLKCFIGKLGETFIVPSLHFDLALTGEKIYVVNPGKNRIELRTLDGNIVKSFGTPGIEPENFSGCCNPANIAVVPDGFITAEKGLNRIKILDREGRFVEFVSSVNDFVPPLPLDIASLDGKIIYGANPADSKVYVFQRKL